MEIECSNCHEHWMVEDKEMTLEERRKWLCRNCIKIFKVETKINQLKEDKENEKGDNNNR